MHYQPPSAIQQIAHPLHQQVTQTISSSHLSFDDSTVPLNPGVLPVVGSVVATDDPRLHLPADKPTDPRSRRPSAPTPFVEDIYDDRRSATSSPLEDEQDYEPMEIYREDSADEFAANIPLKQWNASAAHSVGGVAGTASSAVCDTRVQSANHYGGVVIGGTTNAGTVNIDTTVTCVAPTHTTNADNLRVTAPAASTIYSARYGRRADLERLSDSPLNVSQANQIEDKSATINYQARIPGPAVISDIVGLGQLAYSSGQTGLDIPARETSQGISGVHSEGFNANRPSASETANTDSIFHSITESAAEVRQPYYLSATNDMSSTTEASRSRKTAHVEESTAVIPPIMEVVPVTFTFPKNLHQLFSSAGIAGSLLLPPAVQAVSTTDDAQQAVETNEESEEEDSPPPQRPKETVRTTSLLPQIWPPLMPSLPHPNKSHSSAVEKGRLDHVNVADLKKVLASVRGRHDEGDEHVKAASNDKVMGAFESDGVFWVLYFIFVTY